MAELDMVTLEAATSKHATLLSNLLELYIHDMSTAFPNVELNSDGRFGYPKLPLYWSEPDRRFAFIIRLGERVTGFVFATRGSPVADDAKVLDVAEFFVLRQYRRCSVGRRAALLLWRRIPGRWTVRVSEKNRGAIAFWREVISDLTNGSATETERAGTPNAWRVFSFERAAAPLDCLNAAIGK